MHSALSVDNELRTVKELLSSLNVLKQLCRNEKNDSENEDEYDLVNIKNSGGFQT